MQQFNLVDPKLVPPPLLLSGVRLAVLSALALTAVVAHVSHEGGRLAQTMAQAGAAPVGLAEESAPSGGEGSESAMQTNIRQRRALRDLIAKADDRPTNGAAMLRQVVAALPETAWLTEVDLRGRQGLKISGGTLDPRALRTLAERLSQIDALHGVAVETVRLVPSEPESGAAEAAAPSHAFVLASAAYLSAGVEP